MRHPPRPRPRFGLSNGHGPTLDAYLLAIENDALVLDQRVVELSLSGALDSDTAEAWQRWLTEWRAWLAGTLPRIEPGHYNPASAYPGVWHQAWAQHTELGEWWDELAELGAAPGPRPWPVPAIEGPDPPPPRSPTVPQSGGWVAPAALLGLGALLLASRK